MDAILSDEQRQAIEQNPGAPIDVIDPISQARFVLLPAQAFHRVRALLGPDEFTIEETYALQDQAADEAWSHPGDADYDQYDVHRNKTRTFNAATSCS